AQGVVRYRLQPDSLPDAGGAHVDGAGWPKFTGLFATRLRRLCIIPCANHKCNRLARLWHAVQIAGAPREAAAMSPDLHPIDPDGRVILDGLKMQQHSPASPGLRDGHCSAIPDSVQIIVIFDTSQF